MHEMSLAEELHSIIKEKCNNRPLLKAKFEIGSLSGVVPEAFTFCCETIFKNSFGEKVELIFSTKIAKAQCTCNNIYQIKDMFEACPKCGDFSRNIIEGKDLKVTSIELGDINE